MLNDPRTSTKTSGATHHASRRSVRVPPELSPAPIAPEANLARPRLWDRVCLARRRLAIPCPRTVVQCAVRRAGAGRERRAGNRQTEGHAWRTRRPGCAFDALDAGAAQHQAPRRGWLGNTQSEEAERGRAMLSEERRG